MGTLIGHIVSIETRKKISESLRGRKLSEEAKQKKKGQIPWNIGLKLGSHSKEHNEKISKAHIGKHVGKNNQMWGKKLTQEHREKLIRINTGSKYNLGRKHSEEQNRKMSLILTGRILSDKAKENLNKYLYKTGPKNPMYGKRGKRHPNWRGGKTTLAEQIRKLPEYAIWRMEVFKRDKWTCMGCDHKGGTLNVHHIYSFYRILEDNKIDSIEMAASCEQLWDAGNGITLCFACHNKTKSGLTFQVAVG